jgi:hypothetical protein
MTSMSFMIAELGDGRYHGEDKLECDVRKNTLPTAGYEKQVSQGGESEQDAKIYVFLESIAENQRFSSPGSRISE